MGPIGYSMYTDPVGKILWDNNISYHIYADDTQYVTFDPRTPGAYAAINKLRPVLHRSQTRCYVTNYSLTNPRLNFLLRRHQDPPLNFVMSTYNSVILE